MKKVSNRKKLKMVLNALFEEFKTVHSDDLPRLTEVILETYRLVVNPLRFWFAGFGTCLFIIVAYFLIRILI